MKATGALWDKAAKSWYVGPKANLEKLQHWIPDNVQDQEGPALSPREEFTHILRELGATIAGEHPIMDGKLQRIATNGDKTNEKSGFYVAFLDGHLAGYAKNNRTGEEIRWKS